MSSVPTFLQPYLSHFPPSVDPLTYKLGEGSERLRQTAVFPLFSMPDPTSMNTLLMGPAGLVGVEVQEKLHRFDIRVKPKGRGSLRTNNRVGKEQVAAIQMKWRPIPDDYVALPELEPPPSPFDPQRSQRFVMTDGTFRFLDQRGSGFRAFAAGRTFPTVFGGQPVIQIGAVIDVRRGLGAFAGHEGTVIVNGTINPPVFMSLSVMPVITDFDGSLQADTQIPAIERLPLARVIPVQNQVFATSRTRLRLVHVEFEAGERIRSSWTLGRVVGDVSADFWLGPFAGQFPVPFQSTEGRLDFHDRDGKPAGSLRADIVEGRAFLLDAPGAPMSVFRGAGIAPILEGTGIFRDATGFVAAIALLSLYPRTLSVFYIARLNDPDRRYSIASDRAWGMIGAL